MLLPLLAALSLEAMTLEESVSYALEHNNGLKKADLETASARSIRDAKKGQRFGRVDLLASYDHYNLPRTLAPLTPASLVSVPGAAAKIPTTQDFLTTGVAYNVTLFDGFAKQHDYEMSDLQYRMAGIKTRLGREELIYNVRSLYVTLLTLQEQLAAQKQHTEAQIRLRDKIAYEVEVGTKAKIDLLRAKNSVEASRYQTRTVEADIVTVKAALRRIMGGRPIDRAEPLAFTMGAGELPEDVNVTTLKRYEASRINVEAMKKKEKMADSAYYPRVNFNAYYGQNYGPNDADTYYNNERIISKGDWNNQEVWQVGLKLNWTLLDFGTRSSTAEAARLAQMRARVDSDDVKLELIKNIEKGRSNLALARSQYESAASQFALLEETYAIEKVRYETNALTLTDLLATDAQKELARARMIGAKYGWLKAKYYLDYLFEKGDTQ